jgi:hypothetical protein
MMSVRGLPTRCFILPYYYICVLRLLYMALDALHASSYCSLNDVGLQAAEKFNFFLSSLLLVRLSMMLQMIFHSVFLFFLFF